MRVDSGLPEGFPRPRILSGVGKGWWPIVMRAHGLMFALDPDYTVDQVKEKMGTLRYYYTPESDDPETVNRMRRLVSEAELASTVTCEVCGKPGELDQSKRWLLTLCPEHKAER